jgi:urocanate hydratase
MFKTIMAFLIVTNIHCFNTVKILKQRTTTMNGYVPDGLSEEEWQKIKKKDNKKNLKFEGTSGMKFRSRSFKEFTEGREMGTIEYNMPMENAKEKIKKGLIKPEDIPYMQRPGGMPDNSDLKKKFKFPWEK